MLRRAAANERLQKINPAALWGEATEMECRLLAQTGGWNMGRACPLCPGTSDINLFCYFQSIIHFDAEISDRAFDLGVAKQKLDSPQIAGPPGNQRGLPAPPPTRSPKSRVHPH